MEILRSKILQGSNLYVSTQLWGMYQEFEMEDNRGNEHAPVLGGGGRFETTDTPETIDLDLLLSFQSQSVTDELEVDESPIKTDRTR